MLLGRVGSSGFVLTFNSFSSKSRQQLSRFDRHQIWFDLKKNQSLLKKTVKCQHKLTNTWIIKVAQIENNYSTTWPQMVVKSSRSRWQKLLYETWVVFFRFDCLWCRNLIPRQGSISNSKINMIYAPTQKQMYDLNYHQPENVNTR